MHFPTTDVLQDKEEIAKRLSDLDKVTILGNGDHIKVELFFEDDSTKYRVDTTVWGVTDARVILKQGIVLPINRIYKIVY
ncbi:hypothetical protein K5I29_05335 [Flavobacterium agricola]|uniref:Uncharacterized protein n=1 Tax=Flavobacterium agricola TaxID=2870839 RepID=A0ABY6M3U4_9FLAO|nr:hypothetical protein K5I29_05335 [Flavobacterium agricola]